MNHSWIEPKMEHSSIDEEKIIISPNGNYIAYVIEQGGTDWIRFRVFDVVNNKTLE